MENRTGKILRATIIRHISSRVGMPAEIMRRGIKKRRVRDSGSFSDQGGGWGMIGRKEPRVKRFITPSTYLGHQWPRGKRIDPMTIRFTAWFRFLLIFGDRKEDLGLELFKPCLSCLPAYARSKIVREPIC